MSSWSLPFAPSKIKPTVNITAPRLNNTRVKVSWSEPGITEYQEMVAPHLARIQQLWHEAPSKSSLSLLIKSTDHLLTKAASETNKTIDLGSKPAPRSSKTPRPIKLSQNALIRQYNHIKHQEKRGTSPQVIADLKIKYKDSKIQHRRLVRYHSAQDSIKRDTHLHSVLSKNPSSLFRSLKLGKSCDAGNIQELTVRDRTYLGKNVPDGFFDSVAHLKSLDRESRYKLIVLTQGYPATEGEGVHPQPKQILLLLKY